MEKKNILKEVVEGVRGGSNGVRKMEMAGWGMRSGGKGKGGGREYALMWT